MAKHRAIAEAVSVILLGAAGTIFACRGPSAADPFQAFVDAEAETSVADPREASSDATAIGDGPASDALTPSDAQAYPYPLSRCSIGQDVFYIDVGGPPGPLQIGEITHTDVNTHWYVALQPELNVMLATADGPVGDVQVWTPDSTPVAPGTYPQGPSTTGPTHRRRRGGAGMSPHLGDVHAPQSPVRLAGRERERRRHVLAPVVRPGVRQQHAPRLRALLALTSHG